MEFSVDQQYRLNRLVLSIYGLWPYHNRTTDARIKRVIAILLMFYITFIQVTKICMTELTANFILDVLPILIPSAGVIIQIINRIIINDELRNLFDQIKIDWESVRSQHEIEIMQRSVKNALLTTKVVLLDMFIGMTLYMLTTFSPQILDVLLPLNESRPWEIIKFSGMSDRPMRSAAYVTGQIMYMFMYSYMGQQLIDKSSQLPMKIYSVRWQSIAVCKQKMMLFVMLKCMHTITINAYNIFYLSLESFSSIVQSAMSVCMLLRQV